MAYDLQADLAKAKELTTQQNGDQYATPPTRYTGTAPTMTAPVQSVQPVQLPGTPMTYNDNPILGRPTNPTPVDENAIREQTRQRMQSQLDAINAQYANMISQERIQGQDRSGQTRAINARSGLAGSDFGAAQAQKTTQFNKDQERMIQDEQAAKVSSIMANIEDRASAEIQMRKQEALGQYERDLEAYKEAQTQARADMKILAETGQNLDAMNPAQKAALFKQAGYDAQMGELVFQSLKPKTDWKFEVIGNKVIGYGMGADGQIQTQKADLGFEIPQEMNFQVLPDGTALLVPKTLDRSKSLDEQVFMYGSEGQFAKPADPLDQQKTMLEIQKLQKEITETPGLLATEKDRAAFNQIVGKYQSSPLIKASDRTVTLKGAINAVQADPSNASKQLSLVYGYIQALDTYQSAVREGELSLVNSIDSKTGQIQKYIDQIRNGQVVRADVARQIADAANSLVGYISEGAQQKEQLFASQARVNGIEDAWESFRSGFSTGHDAPRLQLTPITDKEYLNSPGVPAVIKAYPYQEVKAFYRKYPDATMDEVRELVGETGFKSVGNTSASNQVKGMKQTIGKLSPIDINTFKEIPKMVTSKFKEGTRPTQYGAVSDQCGYYVRKVVQSTGKNYPALGDSLKSKIAAVAKYGTSLAKATIGSVIVTKENPTYGHVAYIIGKNAKGWIVSESNFKQSGRISHGRVIPFNSPKLVGVINPTQNV